MTCFRSLEAVSESSTINRHLLSSKGASLIVGAFFVEIKAFSQMLQKQSPCKINLLLNILCKRADGFHELETVMFPVPLYDILSFEPTKAKGVQLTIEGSDLSPGPDNLIVRAANAFYQKADMEPSVSIRLEKRIPMEAGLGGGSGNAGTTLIALNELTGEPLDETVLQEIASTLGSDVPFFLHHSPAIAEGRGEKVITLPSFPALEGKALFLVKPGFGVSTAWAYQNLQRFPDLLNGQAGRGQKLVHALQNRDLSASADLFFNSLEGPVLEKYPLLEIFQTTLRKLGAEVTLMSGSGSTTFALFSNQSAADKASEAFIAEMGDAHWTQVVDLN